MSDVAKPDTNPRHGRREPGARTAGRRPKLSREQQAAIVDAVRSGESTAAQMARHYKVSEPTVSRILAASRAISEVPVAEEPCGERIVGVLPVSALDERLAIVGTSGSGKTYATKGLVERLMQAGARVCVVDPLGVWWGLRLAADGITPARFPVVVFGGQHADVPLTVGMGTALGRLVGTQALACVVDVSDLGSAAARRTFTTAFTEALYDNNTEPLHLVLDEADLWAPQRVQLDGYDLLGRVEEIVRRGRARLRAVADHPAAGGAAQGCAEPGRYPGLDETDIQPGPGGRGPLDRGPGRPGGGAPHPRRPASTRPRRRLGLGAVRRGACARGVSAHPDLRQFSSAAAYGTAPGDRSGAGGPVRSRLCPGRLWG